MNRAQLIKVAAIVAVVVVIGLVVYTQTAGATAAARVGSLTTTTGARGGARVEVVGTNPDGSPRYGTPGSKG